MLHVLNVSLRSFQGLITLQKTRTLWNRTGVFSGLCHGARAWAADVLSKMPGGCALKVSPLDGGTSRESGNLKVRSFRVGGWDVWFCPFLRSHFACYTSSYTAHLKFSAGLPLLIPTSSDNHINTDILLYTDNTTKNNAYQCTGSKKV